MNAREWGADEVPLAGRPLGGVACVVPSPAPGGGVQGRGGGRRAGEDARRRRPRRRRLPARRPRGGSRSCSSARPTTARSRRPACALASHGYVVVLQDTRGRYASEGSSIPSATRGATATTRSSGRRRLPYSDGKVGMFGGSYVGATQMLAAAAHAARTSWPSSRYVTGSEYYEGWTYQSGALMQWFASTWASILAEDTDARRPPRAARNGGTGWSLCPSSPSGSSDPAPAADLAPYYRDWVPARDERRLLAAGEGQGPLQGDAGEGAARRRLARSLPEGLHRELPRSSRAGGDPRGAERPASAPRPLVPRAHVRGREDRRRGLRPGRLVRRRKPRPSSGSTTP